MLFSSIYKSCSDGCISDLKGVCNLKVFNKRGQSCSLLLSEFMILLRMASVIPGKIVGHTLHRNHQSNLRENHWKPYQFVSREQCKDKFVPLSTLQVDTALGDESTSKRCEFLIDGCCPTELHNGPLVRRSHLKPKAYMYAFMYPIPH